MHRYCGWGLIWLGTANYNSLVGCIDAPWQFDIRAYASGCPLLLAEAGGENNDHLELFIGRDGAVSIK